MAFHPLDELLAEFAEEGSRKIVIANGKAISRNPGGDRQFADNNRCGPHADLCRIVYAWHRGVLPATECGLATYSDGGKDGDGNGRPCRKSLTAKQLYAREQTEIQSESDLVSCPVYGHVPRRKRKGLPLQFGRSYAALRW